jgi:hypothetical protein
MTEQLSPHAIACDRSTTATDLKDPSFEGRAARQLTIGKEDPEPTRMTGPCQTFQQPGRKSNGRPDTHQQHADDDPLKAPRHQQR